MTTETRNTRSMFRLWGRKEMAAGVAVPEAPAEPAPARPELPPLVLLADDAVGCSLRRMTVFPEARAASKHIEFWHPQSQRGSLIAFWALTAKPVGCDPAPVEAEALVLVRDPRDSALVTPFSFVDMEAAMDFVRGEIGRGLDPCLAVVVWAVPVDIETTPEGCVRISPECPPDTERPLETERPLQVLWRETAPERATPRPPETPKSSLEGLLQELASALASRSPDTPRPAFQGFGSPQGRF